MNRIFAWQDNSRRLSRSLGAATLGAALPFAALAAPTSQAPVCHALASVTNNLYLVDSSGNPLVRFTSDGVARNNVKVAPDGRRIAWLVAGQHDSTYTVQDTSGHTVSFDPHATDQSGDLEAAGPLMDLVWSSANVVQLEKHVGPEGSLFEYHQINASGPSAPLVGQTGTGVACTQHGDTACVQDGEIQVNGSAVYDQPRYSGTPQASATLAQGATATLSGTPAFTVQILDVSGGQIGLEVTNPGGGWEKGWLTPGVSLDTYWNFIAYSFTATLVDQNAGTVRVDEYVDGDSPGAFDPAITWSPNGHDLWAVYRSNGQANLYVLHPNAGGEDDSAHGSQRHAPPHAGHSDDGHAGNGGWSLVAQAPLNVASVVRSMRLISPNVLLLQTSDGLFSELPITVTHGQPGQNDSLTLGAMTPLPQTLQVKLDPAAPAVQAQVLDWACGLD